VKKLILLYIVLAAVGIALYVEAHAYATDWRGYVAYGGEVFLLAIPVYAAIQILRTIVNFIKDRKEDRYV
jgi:hypothetical protein